MGGGGIFVLAGCLEDDGDSDDGSGGDGNDGQTIQFLTMGVGDNIQEFFEENNERFEEEHDVTLEFTSVTWDNAQQTVNNRVDGGEAPDVARWPARWIPQLVGKGELEPIDDLMEGEFGDRFYQGMADGCKYQGSYYGAPWAASNKCLYYNKDVFEAAGLDPENPQLDTWEDMVAAGEQIRDETDTPALGLAGAAAIETGSQYYHYHWSHGADLIDDDGLPVVNSSEGVEALTLYSDLHQEYGITQPSPLSSNRQDIRQLFESGHARTGGSHDRGVPSGMEPDGRPPMGRQQLPDLYRHRRRHARAGDPGRLLVCTERFHRKADVLAVRACRPNVRARRAHRRALRRHHDRRAVQ